MEEAMTISEQFKDGTHKSLPNFVINVLMDHSRHGGDNNHERRRSNGYHGQVYQSYVRSV